MCSHLVRRARDVALALLATLPAALGAQQQPTGAITGQITEAVTGRPVAYAQVSIPATRQGAATNDTGAYVIRNVAPGTVTLRVQIIGYAPAQRSVVVPASGTATLSVALSRTALTLGEVVVTATGEERTKEIGNTIATIDAEAERAPVANTQDLLTGRASGVTVLANSGQPGAGGSIRLRGVNSISQGNNPIIYVDGVRIYNGATQTNVSGRQSTLPLNDIDASDIERVEIVKGPAATTLYGTEASGGVIQIFTKKGREGQAQWNVEATGGFNNMGHVGPGSDPTGLYVNQCRGPNLVGGDGTKFEDPTCPASGSWLRNGPVQRYALSVRGAASGINYYLSGNLADEQSVLPTGGNRDGGVRGNLEFKPSPAFDLTFNSSFTKRTVTWFPDGNSANGFLLNTSRGQGSGFKGNGCSDPAIVCVNDASLFTLDATTGSNHFITGGTLVYAPSERFSNKLAVGYDYNNANISSVIPFGYPRVPTGQIFQTLWTRSLISVDLASTYRMPIGQSLSSSTAIGGQLFNSLYQSTSLESDNFAGPGLPTLTSGSLRSINDVNDQRVINAGFFAQQTVGWRDRLFVTGGLRVDGNSAFGKSFGLQTYPKVSVAYNLSDESFWPKRWVETLKLRGALGESGKAPGAFDAVRTWDPVAAENGQPAFTPSQVGNPNLGPERTRETEVGFDASALHGRLGLTYTYFRQHTVDALIPVTLPPSNGFSARQLENVGDLFNRGHEVTLTAQLLARRNADLVGRLQYTSIKSEAGNLGGQTITIDALSRTYVQQGLPAPSYIGRRVTNPDAIAAPIIQDNAFLGASFPDQIISPSATLTLFGRLQLDAIGEFQRGGHLLNAVAYQNANLNAWQPCYATQAKLRAAAAGDASALNDVTALMRARCTLDGSFRDYSFWVEKSDFFRLRSVSLTYDLPRAILPHTRNASITLSGRNLWTYTKYSGTDPEVADQRDNTFSRRDYYNFPSYRTFLLTVRAGF